MTNSDLGLMTRFEKESHSFVIRMWQENREKSGTTAVWRGWIEHVQSGQRHHFQKASEIHTFVERFLSLNAVSDEVFEPIQDEQELP